MTKQGEADDASRPGQASAKADARAIAEAERLQRATGTAVVVLENARLRLLAEFRTAKAGRPAIVDGEPAVVDGEPLDPVTWLRDRIRELCARGSLSDAIEELRRESLANALDELAAYVREHREEILRLARPKPE